jgi:hypothetical protein
MVQRQRRANSREVIESDRGVLWEISFQIISFSIADLLFFVLRARRTLGAYRIPRETGLLIPSG